jgi:hypothetical protein
MTNLHQLKKSTHHNKASTKFQSSLSGILFYFKKTLGGIFFFEVNWLHGLDQATTNLLHKKIRREDGATWYDTHPTALFPQDMLS